MRPGIADPAEAGAAEDSEAAEDSDALEDGYAGDDGDAGDAAAAVARGVRGSSSAAALTTPTV
ncbi:hypothetical protein AN220_30370 [Streptomyces nanshensis]|nr:hypothetical protein AN220_30370 [Streptomyces nanshensis]